MLDPPSPSNRRLILWARDRVAREAPADRTVRLGHRANANPSGASPTANRGLSPTKMRLEVRVKALIIEQLEWDRSLRSVHFEDDGGNPFWIAGLDEYSDGHSAPVHFLDTATEKRFERSFAQARSRTTSLVQSGGTSTFETQWIGVPTERTGLSYYALLLPEHAIPADCRFTDPRTGGPYRSAYARDALRQRVVCTLECRSRYAQFDFAATVTFRRASPREFQAWEVPSSDSCRIGDPFALAGAALGHDHRNARIQITNFFSRSEHSVGDTYIVSQAGAVGPSASASHFSQQQGDDRAETGLLVDELRELARLLDDSRDSASGTAIGEAANALEKDEQDRAAGAIRRAGGTALRLARELGLDLAAALIARSLET